MFLRLIHLFLLIQLFASLFLHPQNPIHPTKEKRLFPFEVSFWLYVASKIVSTPIWWSVVSVSDVAIDFYHFFFSVI